MVELVVVGNGSIGIDANGGRYINTHTGELLCELVKSGIGVTYVEPPSKYERDENLQDFDLQHHHLEIALLDSSSKSKQFNSLLLLIRTLAGCKLAYIFFPGKLGLISSLICWVFCRPYGLYVRGEKYDRSVLSRFVVRKARFVLTVSPTIEDDLEQYCHDVGTIRPMVALSSKDLYERPYVTSLPEKWNLLFVGRIEEQKGVRELLEMAKILFQRGHKICLRIVGGGPLFNEIVHISEGGILGNEVILTGLISNRSELMKEYEQAHILVLPSHHEGFPRVLYEAMIKSLPIITTLVGGIPGRMKDGYNCIAVPVGDPMQLTEAVGKLIEDFPLLNTIGRNGQATVTNVLNDERPHFELLLERYNAVA